MEARRGYSHRVRLCFVPVEARSLPQALALGRSMLARAPGDNPPWITASLVEGPAVVLGAHQRAGRVVNLAACVQSGVSVHRRATAGTAAWIGGQALVWTLYLPHVAALARDATANTVLNRNVRGFLQGFTRAGAIAHYFGREWIAISHRPGALLGFEQNTHGAVLLEVIAGYDTAIALPPTIASERERNTDRWRGKTPIALREVTDRSPEEIARRVIEGNAARWQVELEVGELPPSIEPAREVRDPDDPVPHGLHVGPPVSCAIGWIDAATDHDESHHRRVWLGGDVLAPRSLLDAIAQGIVSGRSSLPDTPLLGARMEDLVRAVEEAIRVGHRS